MNLWKYDGRKVKITDVYGQTVIGIADYHSAKDNASGIDSLTIEMSENQSGMLIDFEEPEIVLIEVIYATRNSLAVAV